MQTKNKTQKINGKIREELLADALERLLQTTELNLDEIEPDTRDAINAARAALALSR